MTATETVKRHALVAVNQAVLAVAMDAVAHAQGVALVDVRLDAAALVLDRSRQAQMSLYKTIINNKEIKMRKEIIVKMHEEDSNLVERKHFEYQSARSNIAFLAQESNVNKELFDMFTAIVDKRFYEIEKAKSNMSKKYLPEELKGKNYNFSFDFDNETIVYTLV